MFIDSKFIFVPPGTPLSLVAGAGIGIASGIVDLLGAGAGQAPANIIGNAALFGTDFGIGGVKPTIEAVIGTALATANNATLNMALQLAPDNGSNQPGTWQTVDETGPITAAQGAANTILRLDWAPVFPKNLRPRFAQLLFYPPAATDFTAGTILYAVVTIARDDIANLNTPRNYAVA